MKSCLYQGHVFHARLKEKKYTFKYSLFMFYLDLDELPFLFDNFRMISIERPNFFSFKRSDYHGDPKNSLKDDVKRTVFDLTGIDIRGPVRMLTHLRIMGICFNPVSFYYCFNEEEELQVILAEIENTPWGERFCYACPVTSKNEKVIRASFEKKFHVSPFFDMDISYLWVMSEPKDQLNINMDSVQKDQMVFNASLKTKRLDLNPHNLMICFLKFPWMTLKVVLGIYYQAFRIWLRGTTFFSHPNKTSQKSLLFFKGEK